jgi:hypothetical protein
MVLAVWSRAGGRVLVCAAWSNLTNPTWQKMRYSGTDR